MHLEPGQPNHDDHGCDTRLIFSAAKLEVYRHERLAYTEPPPKRAKSKRAADLLKAMALWAMAHL